VRARSPDVGKGRPALVASPNQAGRDAAFLGSADWQLGFRGHTLTAHTRTPASDDLPREGLVRIDGQTYYAIPDVDRMAPFLMSVVSDGDRWMFVSSSGALTAGRGDAGGALFPYETDDRLYRLAGFNGPVTAIRVDGIDQPEPWRPMVGTARPPLRRYVYKSVVGDSVIFEEVNPLLRLQFRYRWGTSDRFGFIRTATLTNMSESQTSVELIDGLVNIHPHGLDPSMCLSMSNLTNAYKRSELIDVDARLAVFSLESRISDRPEPAEELRGSVTWSAGLDGASVSMDPSLLTRDERDEAEDPGSLVTGQPGAYFLTGATELAPGGSATWHIVSDVTMDQLDVARLRRELRSADDLPAQIASSLCESTDSLVEIMARADALQSTGDRIATAHHFANVTYNVMRGGIPLEGYRVAVDDFERFLITRDSRVARRNRAWLAALPDLMNRRDLQCSIAKTGDIDLLRLGHDYLPFSFSRRHGDPSRPWNAFTIRVADAAGRPVVYYEGNWRDIFQNWEATCMSFPEYFPDLVSVFVNASTVDGFNPYRINSYGVDWEIPDPSDPWSNIGYWGDHQIVYLLRLLEASDRFQQGGIVDLLGSRRFAYANVPYRLVSYDQIVLDPKATIRHEVEVEAEVARRVADVGGDGRLVWNDDGSVYNVSLLEKLLVPALAKLSNFVPGGGIWMNTQRPEWNDANNALVGHGLSMVTLYQLRRYLLHLSRLIEQSHLTEVMMSKEVSDWMAAVIRVLLANATPSPVEDVRRRRKEATDGLGMAFSAYRGRVYETGFSGLTSAALAEISELCSVAIANLDATIADSRRPDGLYHTYNLIRFDADGSSASVEYLSEMLEGQVAVLESGALTPDERADVVDALFASDMYREDQGSFMLYPARELPSFLEKNVIPVAALDSDSPIAALIDAGDNPLLVSDVDGVVRFNADISNKGDLEEWLDRLTADQSPSDLIEEQRSVLLDTFETVFHHRAYTGRSGSMYGYEGIGSIYWHMVAKLLVAIQEALLEARSGKAAPETIDRLETAYWRVRSGLGYNKVAREHGAVPIDPYSHTPAHAGAQQPGMTGLVKEELLVRPLELGVVIDAGRIRFDPLLLRASERLDAAEQWTLFDVDMQPTTINLASGSLGLTICQVPTVVSVTSHEPRVEIDFADGTTLCEEGLQVNRRVSAMIFGRSGEVVQVRAFLHEVDPSAEE
jgi:hypothetical protein